MLHETAFIASRASGTLPVEYNKVAPHASGQRCLSYPPFEKTRRVRHRRSVRRCKICRDHTNLFVAEIESQKEVKSADELSVPLPKSNFDFHELALAWMTERLNRKVHGVPNADGHGTQSEPTRESVARIARLANYQPTA